MKCVVVLKIKLLLGISLHVTGYAKLNNSTPWSNECTYHPKKQLKK